MSKIKIEKQFAIYLDNRPGMLAHTCEALKKAGVNMLALSVLDTVDHAVVRIVVDRAREAEKVLVKMHTLVQIRDVVFMEVRNEPGDLATIANKLAAAGINLEYAYCTCAPSQDAGAIVLRTNDLEATINALS